MGRVGADELDLILLLLAGGHKGVVHEVPPMSTTVAAANGVPTIQFAAIEAAPRILRDFPYCCCNAAQPLSIPRIMRLESCTNQCQLKKDNVLVPLICWCQRALAAARCRRALRLHVGFAVLSRDHQGEDNNDDQVQDVGQDNHVQGEERCKARSPGKRQQ